MILEHVCIAMVHNWCFCDFWVGAWWTKKFRRHMLQAFKLSIGKLWNPKLLQGVVNPQQNRLISMGSTPAMGPLYDYIIWRVIPRLVIGPRSFAMICNNINGICLWPFLCKIGQAWISVTLRGCSFELHGRPCLRTSRMWAWALDKWID